MTTITQPKIYQAVLPLRNRRIIKPVPMPQTPVPPKLEVLQTRLRGLKQQFDQVFTTGFWFCRDCNQSCERNEGENGQPAYCDRCGSPRIAFVEPIKGKEAA